MPLIGALGDRYSDDMPEEIEIGSMTVGKLFFKDMVGYDVRNEIPGFDKPVLILQGSEAVLCCQASQRLRRIYIPTRNTISLKALSMDSPENTMISQPIMRWTLCLGIYSTGE